MEWSLVAQPARKAVGTTGNGTARPATLSLTATLAAPRTAVDRSNNVSDRWPPASITAVHSNARQAHDYSRRSQADRGDRHNR
jgi:hypothetical protein